MKIFMKSSAMIVMGTNWAIDTGRALQDWDGKAHVDLALRYR